MRKVPFKNYLILGIIILIVFFLTLVLRKTYIDANKNDAVSFNTIEIKDFNQYTIENSDLILYMYNSRNNLDESFQSEFVKKLKKVNLYERVVGIDCDGVENDLNKILKEKYNIDIDTFHTPIILIIKDNKKDSVIYVNINNYNINTIINYKVFK